MKASTTCPVSLNQRVDDQLLINTKQNHTISFKVSTTHNIKYKEKGKGKDKKEVDEWCLHGAEDGTLAQVV